MAKNNKKLDSFTENEYSGARLLQKILEKSDYTDQRQVIKDTFDRVAPSPAIEIINEIAEMTEIPKEDRQQALTSIYHAMIQAMEKVETIELPDVKWKARGKENWHMSPCDFFEKHYPENVPSLATIASHDKPLYDALNIYKTKGLWHEGFHIPTTKEANDITLAQLDKAPTLSEIAQDAPPHIREQLRIYELTRGRHKSIKKPKR